MSKASERSSSTSSTLVARSDKKNPIFHIVNDFYAKQQADYMQQRRNKASDSGITVPTSSSPYTPQTNISEVNVSAVSAGSSAASRTPPPERLAQWAKKREEAIRVMQEEQAKRESLNLTFQPNAERVRTPRGHARALVDEESFMVPSVSEQTSHTATPRRHNESMATGHDISTELLPVRERLLVLGELANRRKDAMRLQRDLDLAEQHPFEPQISQSRIRSSSNNRRSWKSGNVSATTESWENMRRTSDRRPPVHEDPECTFCPVIDSHSKEVYTLPRRADEGQMDVFTRLYSRSIAMEMNERSPSAHVSHGAPEAPVAPSEKRLADIFAPPIIEELQSLRTHFGLKLDKTNFEVVAPSKEPVSVPFDIFLTNALLPRSKAEAFVRTTFQSESSKRFVIPVEIPSDDDDNETIPMSQSELDSLQFVEELPDESPHKSGRKAHPSREFFRRQQEAEARRFSRLQALAKKVSPSFMPSICDGSKMIVEKKREDSSKDAPAKRSAKKSQDISYTFRPVITKIGNLSAPRGTNDMHLDHQRKIEKIEEFQRKNSLKDSEALTFQPATNRGRNAQVESTLNPRSLDVYRLNLEQKREDDNEKRRLQREKEEEEEVSECTFRPRINKTPTFITRMATGFSVVRSSVQ